MMSTLNYGALQRATARPGVFAPPLRWDDDQPEPAETKKARYARRKKLGMVKAMPAATRERIAAAHAARNAAKLAGPEAFRQFEEDQERDRLSRAAAASLKHRRNCFGDLTDTGKNIIAGRRAAAAARALGPEAYEAFKAARLAALLQALKDRRAQATARRAARSAQGKRSLVTRRARERSLPARGARAA